MAVHQGDALTQADQPQQAEGTNPGWKAALSMDGPAVQIVHLGGGIVEGGRGRVCVRLGGGGTVEVTAGAEAGSHMHCTT